MIDFFHNLYSNIVNENKALTQIRFYSLQRYLVRQIANIALPIYFKLTANNPDYKLAENTKQGKRLVVSLTTFPARIGKVWLVIESMLRQTRKPDVIELWLSQEQFTSLKALPQCLLNLRKRGLSIEFCKEDYRSHKKYFYAFQKHSNDIVVTIDDDIIYSTNLIEKLYNTSKSNPEAIISNNTYRIKRNNGEVTSYNNWELINNKCDNCDDLFFGSGGGTLFPPNSLHNDLFLDMLFLNLCPYADDIWLNTMARLNRTKVIPHKNNCILLPILNSSNITLSKSNVYEGRNDTQLNSVRKYYVDNKKTDPFN